MLLFLRCSARGARCSRRWLVLVPSKNTNKRKFYYFFRLTTRAIFLACPTVRQRARQKCIPCVSRIGRSGPTTVSSIAGRRARAWSVSGMSVETVGTRGASCPSERPYPMCADYQIKIAIARVIFILFCSYVVAGRCYWGR